MRRVRDYDAELKALNDKARLLRTKKVQQLGELVVATGAEALNIELLAGLLVTALETSDDSAKEAWRARGAAFFQRRAKKTVLRPRPDQSSASPDSQGDPAG